MARYVRKDGQWVDKDTGEPMDVPDRIATPMVHSDIQAYKSPLGEYWVDGRRAQREDLKRNDCVINERPRQKFDREEYAWRKSQQAKVLEERKSSSKKVASAR